MEPVTGYARLGDQRIYYQTIGEGPPDLIINTGAWGSIDVEWEDPDRTAPSRAAAGRPRSPHAPRTVYHGSLQRPCACRAASQPTTHQGSGLDVFEVY